MSLVYFTPNGPVYKESKLAQFNGQLYVNTDEGIHYVPSKRGKEDEMGYVVRAVIKNGPADQAGIKAGDTILTIGGLPVDNKNLNKRLNAHKNMRVFVRYKRTNHPGGTAVHLARVLVGSKTKNGTSVGYLGTISNKAKADAYLGKLVRRGTVTKKKKVAKKRASIAVSVEIEDESKKLIEQLRNPEPSTNHYKKRAMAEMAQTIELMQDLDGVEALREAKNLRTKLLAENRKALERTTEIVQGHLNGMVEAQRAKESAEDSYLKKLSKPRKRWKIPGRAKTIAKVTATTVMLSGLVAMVAHLAQIW